VLGSARERGSSSAFFCRVLWQGGCCCARLRPGGCQAVLLRPSAALLASARGASVTEGVRRDALRGAHDVHKSHERQMTTRFT